MKDAELRKNFEIIGQEFKKIDERFEGVDDKFDFLATQLLELKEKLLPVAADYPAFKDHVISTLDRHTHLLERLDQDRLAQHARTDRLEGRVDRLETHTGLA